MRDASPCPRCGPWCRHARTRPTASIDLPDQPTRGHLFTGVVADVCRRGGRRGGRGGLSPPLPRVDPGAAMLRATRPGDDRRNDLSSCSGAQAGWPLRGRAQASYAAAGQPQGSSGRHSSGGLRGSPKPCATMVITIVGHVATVSPGVKTNGSASVCLPCALEPHVARPRPRPRRNRETGHVSRPPKFVDVEFCVFTSHERAPGGIPS